MARGHFWPRLTFHKGLYREFRLYIIPFLNKSGVDSFGGDVAIAPTAVVTVKLYSLPFFNFIS